MFKFFHLKLSSLYCKWHCQLHFLPSQRCMAQMLLLAGPGVLISTFCLGTVVKVRIEPATSTSWRVIIHDPCLCNLPQLAFPYNWNWKTSLLLGGLLSATDPVAVVALLKDLGASKKLSTIIEGESLMNDGYWIDHSWYWRSLLRIILDKTTKLETITCFCCCCCYCLFFSYFYDSRTAIVVYQLFYQMVLGKSFDAGSIFKFLSQVSLGAYVSLPFLSCI